MVDRFREKPKDSQDRINGGFFVMEPEVLDLLDGAGCGLRPARSRRSRAGGSSRRTSTTGSGCRWTPCVTGTS